MNLKLNNLSKRFADQIILSDFSFSFDETGLYVITGESGIGKTTLLRIIAGLDKDFTGEVVGAGIENVSFMFQEYRLFHTLSAVKNVAVSNKDPDLSEAMLLLKRLGFSDEDLKKKPRHLSGGMKQRVAFARAVFMNSPILILDEPTKELDPDSIKIMLEIIKEEAEKRLVIAVTHDSALINADARNIIHINQN